MRLHPAHPDDPWGDDIQNMGQHTTRHTDVNEVWEQAFTYCFGKHNLIIGPRNQGAAVEWSPGHIPDITALNKAPGGFHVLADTKVGNVFSTAYDGTPAAIAARAASIPFAASGEYYYSMVHGRPAISIPQGTSQQFNRRNYVGKKAAVKGDYEPAKSLGHTAILLLSEVTGALHPDGRSLLRQLAALHEGKLPHELRGQSWTASSFESYFLQQRLSSAVNMAAAHEIRSQICKGPRLVCAAGAWRQALQVV